MQIFGASVRSSQLLSIEKIFFEVFTVVLASTSLSSPLDTRWLLMWWEEKKDLQLYRWIQEKKDYLASFTRFFLTTQLLLFFFQNMVVKLWPNSNLKPNNNPARIMTWSRTTFFPIFFCRKNLRVDTNCFSYKLGLWGFFAASKILFLGTYISV